MTKLNIEKIKEHAHVVQDLQCTVVFHKDDNNVTTAVVYANQHLGGAELVRYTDTDADGRDMIEQLRLIIQEQKESAKTKTVGDLTIREVKEIEDKICNDDCGNCPFGECCVTNYCDLEQEIEVDNLHENT